MTNLPPTILPPPPNPYCTGSPDHDGRHVLDQPPARSRSSRPGPDGLWGIGGQYLQTNTGGAGKLPIAASDPGIVHAIDFMDGVRGQESDNLTDFSGGRLAD